MYETSGVPKDIPTAPRWYKNDRWMPRAIVIFAILVATLLITRTYRVFNQITDEPIHIAAGLEWLERGTYHYEPLHPPLARIFAAFGLFATGLRTQEISDELTEGNAVLESRGQYQRNLTLARLGILPLFWFSCYLLWSFMKKAFGAWHGAIAVMILCLCPPVLAHSSVATTDLPLLAMFLLALTRIWSLLREPSHANAILAGLTIGLAVATKFSAIPYLFTSCTLLFICGLYWRTIRVPSLRNVLVALAFVLMTIWALYRFSIGPILELSLLRPDQLTMLQNVPKSILAFLYFKRVPAHEFCRGLISVYAMNLHGRNSYLLGKTYVGGRWAFFPVAILVKTPIALLILSILGLIYALSRKLLRANKNISVPIAGIAGPLLIAIPSNINIGLRHVLLVYPFVAMFAALAVVELWKASSVGSRPFTKRVIVVVLLGWNAASCILAAPDFLAYFNEAAAPYASKILIDSDLDWGQDLFRLISIAHQENIPSLSLAYEGSIDLPKHCPPAWVPLPPQAKVKGWIAISEFKLKMESAYYGWLNQYKPVRKIGHSIRLYYVDKDLLPGNDRP